MWHRYISTVELAEILRKHKLWIMGEKEGEKANLYGAYLSRAYLSGANLSGANLSEANLSRADLSGANLSRADLFGANLYEANLYEANLSVVDLRGANLSRVNLSGANLREANPSEANLYGADLRGADIRGANLSRANLYGAYLYGANLVGASLSIPMACPEEGAFIGWKKVRSDLIVKLLIPEDAKRSSATGRKCRCDKAEVIAIETIEGNVGPEVAYSSYDPNFVYKVGAVVTVSDFDDDRFNECAPGIHFFINRQEAVNYT